MPEPRVSIVVLSLNRYQDIKRCINSIYNYTKEPFELIVWDNHSTDDKVISFLKALQKRNKARVIFSNENIGCSNGRREALKYVHPAVGYIVTLDNDMKVTKNWLITLINRVEESPDIGAAASKIVFPSRFVSFFKKHELSHQIQLNGGLVNTSRFPLVDFRTVDSFKKWDDPTTFEKRDCDWLPGGALLVKKTVAQKVMHSPEYPCGYEDYAYSFDIKKAGFRLVNCPDSVVFHHNIFLRSEKYQEQEKEYFRQRNDYWLKQFSLINFYKNTGMIPYDNSHSLVYEVYNRPLPEIVQFFDAHVQRMQRLYEILSRNGLGNGVVISFNSDEKGQECQILVENEKYLLRIEADQYELKKLPLTSPDPPARSVPVAPASR